MIEYKNGVFGLHGEGFSSHRHIPGLGADGKLIIKLAMFLIPLIMIVVGYIVYLKKYKISEEFYSEMLKDLEAREKN